MKSVPFVPAMRGFVRIAILIAMLAICFAPAAQGQFADASQAGAPVAIHAPWRFHIGDDPQWATPGFDDSQWPLIRLDKSWAEQGHKFYSGFAWYRMKVKLPATKEPLALGVTEIVSADEIYADGQLIGAIGKMRPTPVWLGYSMTTHAFALPTALNGRTIELAIRVWQPQASSNDVAFTGRALYPLVGSVQTIANLSEISTIAIAATQIPLWLEGATALGIGLFSLGLFFLRRRATEYAWAALFLFADAGRDIGEWLYHSYQWPAFDWIFGANCLSAALLIFWLLFIWRFLRAPADKLLRTGIVLLLLAPIPVLFARAGYISVTDASLTWVIVPLVLTILVVARLVRLAWQGNRDAQLLLAPFLLSNLMTSVMWAMDILYWFGAIKSRRGIAYLTFYRGSAFSLSWDWLFTLLADLAVAVLLMLRFARTAERDERLSAEMEAAHSVQAQLVPALLPATPHFRFESAYLAASEVGGDFYQVYPQSDSSVLIAIGDVSGKGLKAAMLGTLVVGALRSLVQENLPLAEILARLNRQLADNSDGSFVTCCVARIDSDGMLIIANAGHLPPYRNGEEISCESGLPLGLTATAEFAETTLQLVPGDKLTFLSDGVVEARDPSGELFGFQRTLAISGQTADHIARAARDFGQQDDITVLTFTFAPASKPVEALHA